MSSAMVIILVGSFVALSSALVGSFLVLRKMSLLGDAISHAVLPGIVAAFMITSSRASGPMVLGAAVLGVFTVFLVGMLKESKRLGEDASIGVVFPALFSLGVILISKYTGQVDLDLDCVLYGEILYAPLEILYWGDTSLGPESLWTTGSAFLVIAAFVILFYKELKLTTFDPLLAESLGFSPRLMHYLLMGAVSLTVVAAFEAVGAILVVAMLIVPAATAYLLTTRLSYMILLSSAFGVCSSIAGYLVAARYDYSVSGSMASSAGLFFLVVLIFSPHGLVSRALLQRRIGSRLAGQMFLLHLQDESQSQPREVIMKRFGWSAEKLSAVVSPLLARGEVEEHAAGYSLTEKGRGLLESIGSAGLVHKPAL